jgi:hypothetical protein
LTQEHKEPPGVAKPLDKPKEAVLPKNLEISIKDGVWSVRKGATYKGHSIINVSAHNIENYAG